MSNKELFMFIYFSFITYHVVWPREKYHIAYTYFKLHQVRGRHAQLILEINFNFIKNLTRQTIYLVKINYNFNDR